MRECRRLHFCKLVLNMLPCVADICPTVLKKICRKHGLKRWPNRRIRSIDKQVALLETVIQDGCSEGKCTFCMVTTAITKLKVTGAGDDHKKMEIADQIYLLQLEKAKICFQVESD
jgi:hypothetical protein